MSMSGIIDLCCNKEGKFRRPAQVINQSFHFNIGLLSRMLAAIMNINEAFQGG